MASSQALKNQLFSTLNNQGFHEQIKKQLRMKLIEQLKDKKMLQTKNQKKMLFERVLSSLVMQELQINQFPFTESIYTIESGFQGSHITRDQLIEILTFKRSQIKDNESILQFILRKKQPFASTTLQNIQIQTNPQQIGYTLQQKLMMVDQQYRMNLVQKQNINKSNIFDRKKFEFQLIQKSKKEIDLFKQFEAHKIKIKVGEQWRKKFQDYSNSLAEEYRRKHDQLRKKDRNLNEEYILKHNQLNFKTNDTQKTTRQKIQVLDMKSVTLQTQMQNVTKGRKDFQDQMIKKQKQLFDKIRQYDSLVLNVNQKVKYEVNLTKLVLQQEYQERQAQSMRRKRVIDEDYGKLMGIKDSIDIVQKQNVRLSNQNNNLRTRTSTLETQLKDIILQVGNKVSRIQVLKDDLVSSQQKRKNTQQKLKEQTKRAKRYQNQIIAMRQQLQQLRLRQYTSHNVSQISHLSSQPERNVQSKRMQEVNKRMQRLKNQRKRDIQKFRLQL